MEKKSIKLCDGVVLDSEIDLTPYDLPDIKPIEKADVFPGNPENQKTYFTTVSMRGPKSEIERVKKEYDLPEKVIVTDVFGIYETRGYCSEPFSDKDILPLEKIIRDYPALKIIAFLENRAMGTVWVAFSESGYWYITDKKYVGEFDWKASPNYQWQWCNFPGNEFKDVFMFLQVDAKETIRYKPFQEWNDANYVINWDGNNYLLSNLDQLEPEYSTNPHDMFVRDSNGYDKYVGHLAELVCTDDMFLAGEISKRNIKPPTENYDILKSLTITRGIKKIKENAFRGCSNLRKLIIPECDIRSGAFADCQKLEYVVIYGDDHQAINAKKKVYHWEDVFSNCPSLKYVYYLRPEIKCLTNTTFSTPNEITVFIPEGASVISEASNVRIQKISEEILPDILDLIGASLPYDGFLRAEERCDFDGIPAIGDIINVKQFEPNELQYYIAGKKEKWGNWDQFLPVLKGLSVNIEIKGVDVTGPGFDVTYRISLAKENDVSHISKKYKFSDRNSVRFDGKNFAVDGMFLDSPVEHEINKRGGMFRTYVAKNTDYLIYSKDANSPDKMQKAMDFKQRGLSHTEFLTVNEFYEMIRKKD